MPAISRPMPAQRQKLLLALITERRWITVAELTRELHASSATVRRASRSPCLVTTSSFACTAARRLDRVSWRNCGSEQPTQPALCLAPPFTRRLGMCVRSSDYPVAVTAGPSSQATTAWVSSATHDVDGPSGDIDGVVRERYFDQRDRRVDATRLRHRVPPSAWSTHSLSVKFVTDRTRGGTRFTVTQAGMVRPAPESSGEVSNVQPYTPQLRRRALDLLATGRSVSQTAAELQVTEQTVYQWREQLRIDTGQKPGIRLAENTELVVARRHVAALEAELAMARAAVALLARVHPGAGSTPSP